MNVIASTFLLKSFSLFSLIDSGSTHSYIVTDLASKLGVPIKTIMKGMVVMSSLGRSVVVDQVYRRCSFSVQGYIFLVDLMELSFRGFDIILEMD